MNTVQIDQQQLRALRDHALAVGTLVAWSNLALTYAEQAADEIARLTALLRAVGHQVSPPTDPEKRGN